jgi:hypothetical protein
VTDESNGPPLTALRQDVQRIDFNGARLRYWEQRVDGCYADARLERDCRSGVLGKLPRALEVQPADFAH